MSTTATICQCWKIHWPTRTSWGKPWHLLNRLWRRLLRRRTYSNRGSPSPSHHQISRMFFKITRRRWISRMTHWTAPSCQHWSAISRRKIIISLVCAWCRRRRGRRLDSAAKTKTSGKRAPQAKEKKWRSSRMKFLPSKNDERAPKLPSQSRID